MEQLSVIFEPGLAVQHRSLRSCVAAAVYRRGETKVAGEIDSSVSHLCEKLAGCDSSGRKRGMTLDEFEAFLQASGDLTPIYYLIERYIRSNESKQQAAMLKLAEHFPELIGLMVDAGLLDARAQVPAGPPPEAQMIALAGEGDISCHRCRLPLNPRGVGALPHTRGRHPVRFLRHVVRAYAPVLSRSTLTFCWLVLRDRRLCYRRRT